MTWTKRFGIFLCLTTVCTAPLAWAAPSVIKVPTIADPVKGLDLWRGAKVGMGVSQVLALFHGAAAPPNPTTLTGGEVDRLQLTGVDLAGHPAVAHFYFNNDELVSVQLSLNDLRAAASVKNITAAEQISAEISALYGASYDCGDKSFADVAAYECKWLKKPLSIRLWYMDTSGQAPLFYLAYRQADDPGYNL